MEESEKMTALKKAYAEIILNTAKEAAAKVMASERKARRFQHDLSAAKEEALRLLLRLKQTMDSKVSEAEMKSLCQQKRIDELEAQLQEAEDIVTNLRSELNEAHMRLDETTKTQKHNAPEITKKVVCVEEVAQHVNVVYGYTGVPEVPSIIARNKEPELYRNGCTQRIRAYEGSLLNGHISPSGDLKNEKTTIENKGERLHMTPPLASEITFPAEDNSVEIKEVKNNGKPSYLVSSLIRRKRKRGARYRRSYNSPLKSIPPLIAKEALSASIAPSSVPKIVAPNEHKADAKGEDEDREVANSLVLIREQSISEDCLHAPSSIPQIELENVASVKLDSKVPEKVDWIPSPPAKDRVLKYTFQRKRKRETLSSENSTSLNQENSMRRKMGKKPNEPLKSSAESRDSRRMAQVARQVPNIVVRKEMVEEVDTYGMVIDPKSTDIDMVEDPNAERGEEIMNDVALSESGLN